MKMRPQVLAASVKDWSPLGLLRVVDASVVLDLVDGEAGDVLMRPVNIHVVNDDGARTFAREEDRVLILHDWGLLCTGECCSNSCFRRQS